MRNITPSCIMWCSRTYWLDLFYTSLVFHCEVGVTNDQCERVYCRDVRHPTQHDTVSIQHEITLVTPLTRPSPAGWRALRIKCGRHGPSAVVRVLHTAVCCCWQAGLLGKLRQYIYWIILYRVPRGSVPTENYEIILSEWNGKYPT